MTPNQRGITIFNALLFEEDNVATVSSPQQNGRNPELIAARDNYLLHRFYFKTKIERKQYNDALNELTKEIWISKLQITKIIQAKADNILLIKRQQPSAKLLREAWPHIIW